MLFLELYPRENSGCRGKEPQDKTLPPSGARLRLCLLVGRRCQVRWRLPPAWLVVTAVRELRKSQAGKGRSDSPHISPRPPARAGQACAAAWVPPGVQLKWQVGCLHNAVVQGPRVGRSALPPQPSAAQPGRWACHLLPVVARRMSSGLRVTFWDAAREGCAPCCAAAGVLISLGMTIETAGPGSPCLCSQRREVVGDMLARLSG